MSRPRLSQRLFAEVLGTTLLLATIVGSGVMAERLSAGNGAVALLGNTLPTGAMLIVLITMLGPISGAHFNPAVTLAFWLRRQIGLMDAAAYAGVQVGGAVAGVMIAHAMFELPIVEVSMKARGGLAQVFSEGVATFGLVLTVLLTLKAKPHAVAANAGLYIVAAYWFTASTSFANPAVTLARSLTNTFAGIRPDDVAVFIVAQLVGAICGLVITLVLAGGQQSKSNEASCFPPAAPGPERI